MRFLFRVAFWLSVAVMLLPTGPQPSGSTEQQVSAAEALSAASATASDLRQFCARQPETCVVGSRAMSRFEQKARLGARMLLDLFNQKPGAEHPGASVASDAQGRPALAKSAHDTLRPADLAPAWHGPTYRKDAEAKHPA